MLHGQPNRARLTLVMLCVAVALFAALSAQDATELVPGGAVEREISPGQSHAYRVQLSAGDLLDVAVAQHGIDLAVTVVRPDGHALLAVDAMDDEFRPETVVAIVDDAGAYTIAVRPAPTARASGRYTVRLEAPRLAVAADNTRVEAERAFASGRKHREVNRAATWPDALATFKTARDRYAAIGDRAGAMKALIEIAVTENYMSKAEAVTAAEEAERLARAIDDRPALARVLRVEASIYALSGDAAAAARSVEEATVINRAIGHRLAEAHSLNYAALMHRRLGNLETAIAMFEEARSLARLTTDRALEANVVNNLGVIYSWLDEPERSVSAFAEALAIARSTNDRRAQFTARSNLARGQGQLGRHAEARKLLFEALEDARQIGSAQLEASALAALGWTDRAAGDLTQALDHLRRAAAIYTQLGDVRLQADSQFGVGLALRALGRHEDAASALEPSLTTARQLRERLMEREVLVALARVERTRGDLDRALRYVRQSVDLDETVRAEITSPDLRTTFVASEHDRYGLLIDLLQQKHAADPAGGHNVAAFEVSERARARVLLDSLLDARVDLRDGIDPALLQREQSLQKQLNEASSQLSRTLARPGDKEKAAAVARQVDRLTVEHQDLQAQVRRQSPRYASVMQPQPLTTADIQQSVIDDDTVLLEFALGEERSWLWAVTPQKVTSFELPRRREIDRATRALYELFTARQKRGGESGGAFAGRVTAADARLAQQAAEVSRMLLGGIARQLRGEWRSKRLAIVAGGVLEYLPFAALPIPDHANGLGTPRSLVSEHEIIMLPSASVLAVLRQEAPRRTPASRTLAVLADPVFEATDPRVTAKPTAVSSSDGHQSRAIDVMDSLYGRDGLARLPFSREEANAIAALAAPTDILKAVDFRASRAMALGGGLRGYRIVHVATHGVVDSERPALSSLVLSLVDERGARQNGYLRLHDIYNMRLDADLVVLSACQTALGKEIKGEGLVGLTRAFMYGGTPRVVASLWKVSDLATAELMKAFYRGMLSQHLSPAAALRAAQLQLSRDPRWASPYFWAGFVLQGEYR